MILPPRAGGFLLLAFADDLLAPGLVGVVQSPFAVTRLALVAVTALWTVRARNPRWPAAHGAVSVVSVAVVLIQSPTRSVDLVTAAVTTAIAIPLLVAAVRSSTAKDEASLIEVARLDPLTGVLNRRGLEAWAHSNPGPTTLTVIVVDVDDLKGHNSRHGHAGGDAVLVAVASALAASTRPGQAAARLGGDEFAFLASGPSAEIGAEMIRRVRAAAVQAALAAGASVTVGATSAPWTDGSDLADLLHRADAHLLADKHQSKGGLRCRRDRMPSTSEGHARKEEGEHGADDHRRPEGK